MKQDEEFRPLLSELIDLLNQQKTIAENLLEGARQFDKDGKIIAAWQTYLSKLDEQDKMLFDLAKDMEISFENDLYEKMVEK